MSYARQNSFTNVYILLCKHTFIIYMGVCVCVCVWNTKHTDPPIHSHTQLTFNINKQYPRKLLPFTVFFMALFYKLTERCKVNYLLQTFHNIKKLPGSVSTTNSQHISPLLNSFSPVSFYVIYAGFLLHLLKLYPINYILVSC